MNALAISSLLLIQSKGFGRSVIRLPLKLPLCKSLRHFLLIFQEILHNISFLKTAWKTT